MSKIVKDADFHDGICKYLGVNTLDIVKVEEISDWACLVTIDGGTEFYCKTFGTKDGEVYMQITPVEKR